MYARRDPGVSVAAIEDTLDSEGTFLDDCFVFTVGDDIDVLTSATTVAVQLSEVAEIIAAHYDDSRRSSGDGHTQNHLSRRASRRGSTRPPGPSSVVGRV